MRVLAQLIALIFVMDAMAYPLGTKGQKQSGANSYPPVINVPNNQNTPVGSGNVLFETGNLNLLQNPGFEHGTYTTGWTTTGTTATISAEVSNLISGNKAFKAVSSAQNISLVQDSTLYAAQLAGMQGYVQKSCSNTAPNVQLCARGAGVTSTTDCVTLATDGAWKQYEIPVVLSATSNGISLAATSTTGTTICDEGYVGLISGKTPEVAQAQLAGEAYFAGTTNCTWTRTSTTVGAFGTDADCPGPTIVRQNIGSWQTTDSDLPRVTVNSLPAGDYVAKFIVPANITGNAFYGIAIHDGTTTCEPSLGTSFLSANGVSVVPVECSFSYTSPGNRSFELYAASSANTAQVQNNSASAPRISLKFILEYYPPASKIYSQQCQNNPTACENVFSATISASGVVSGENLDWINGNCSVSSGYICNFNSGIFTTTPSCATSLINSDNNAKYHKIKSVSSSAVTGFTSNTGSGFVAFPMSIVCQKTDADFKAQNVITGTFAEMMKVPGVSKPVQFGFRSSAACTTGSCPGTFYGDTIGAGSVAFTSTGTYTTTIPAGKCAATPWCTGGLQAFVSTQFRCNTSASSATSVSTICQNNLFAVANEGFNFMCWCQAP